MSEHHGFFYGADSESIEVWPVALSAEEVLSLQRTREYKPVDEFFEMHPSPTPEQDAAFQRMINPAIDPDAVTVEQRRTLQEGFWPLSAGLFPLTADDVWRSPPIGDAC